MELLTWTNGKGQTLVATTKEISVLSSLYSILQARGVDHAELQGIGLRLKLELERRVS